MYNGIHNLNIFTKEGRGETRVTIEEHKKCLTFINSNIRFRPRARKRCYLSVPILARGFWRSFKFPKCPLSTDVECVFPRPSHPK